VKLATTGSTNADEIMLASKGQFAQFIPGNRMGFTCRVALSGTPSDIDAYFGLADGADPTTPPSNGIFFKKAHGGTVCSLVIISAQAGGTTTFSNVADLAKPSGLQGDSNAVAGAIGSTISGGNYTALTVTTPGSGYVRAPLVLATGASGANALLGCQLGGSGVNVTNPATSATQIPYSSLYAPFIINPGNTSYTTGTVEVDPWIDLAFWYDGFGTFEVGVNGRVVMTIRGSATQAGTTAVSVGNTYNLATSGVGPSFTSNANLTTSAYGPVLPATGDPLGLLPLDAMQAVMGFKNTTANARAIYVSGYKVMSEWN
jgi:hypothetical protein